MNHPMSVNANTRVRWSALRHVPCLRDLRGKHVFDAAAGLGFFSARFAALGAEVLAADIDARSLAYCKTIPHVRTLTLNLERDDVPEGPFDLIFVGEVMEHLKIPEEFLSKASSKLRPGGTLIVTTPAEEGILSHSCGKRLAHEDGAEKHERDGFTLAELQYLLKQAGLHPSGHLDCIYFLSELFMQTTKWFYMRKTNSYRAQSDILSQTQSASYRALRLLYPLLHPLFVMEDMIWRQTRLAGHCHIVWAEKS